MPFKAALGDFFRNRNFFYNGYGQNRRKLLL